jgi:Chaperone of endosialidase
MNLLIQVKKPTLVFLVVLACFAVSPVAQAVSPPPDGGYPNFNTAEGTNALFSLTTGGGNTALGANALLSLTTGIDNTATGTGALRKNTHSFNTADGFQALLSNTTGELNTAAGFQALNSNTSGAVNAAVGSQALASNTTGGANNAFGWQALFSNTVGVRNSAVGTGTLSSLTSGDSNIAVGGGSLGDSGSVNFNTALGRRALFRTQGDQNTGLGFFTGSNLNGGTNNIYIGNVGPVPIGTESNTIRLGTETATVATIGSPPVESHVMPAHTATFIAGITGTPVTGDPVVVDANGQLGTATSSARFKKEIKPIDKASESILALKPVSFRYKSDSKGTPQFGLIAEEVAKVNPDLVVRDRNGEIYSVRYEAVNAMLLNEFLKEHRTVQELKKQIEALTAGLQKVSAQIELNKPAPQTVLNNH